MSKVDKLRVLDYLDHIGGSPYETQNALSHGYFKVDLEIVWNTIRYD